MTAMKEFPFDKKAGEEPEVAVLASTPIHKCPPSKIKIRVGPEPLLLSRKEIDVLYDIFDVARKALKVLGVDYVVTGGSLLGAIRQHSILFCDDDIDIAIIDHEVGKEKATSVYESIIVPHLQSALDRVVKEEEDRIASSQYVYQIKPWEGGDRIRSRRFNSVFLDLFVLRKYPTKESFLSVIGRKKNGQPQPESYVNGILDAVRRCVTKNDSDEDSRNTLFPFWQFATRKAIELWPKEVYLAALPTSSDSKTQRDELFPLRRDLKFGPLTGVCGPNTPVTLLKRAFGDDCFEVYYRSISHGERQPQPSPSKKLLHDRMNGNAKDNKNIKALPPKVAPGGTWDTSPKVLLEEQHYLPMQPLARQRRRPTPHCRHTLFEYLQQQTILEEAVCSDMRAREAEIDKIYSISSNSENARNLRPRRTVYMYGVFDLFHIGHLQAIRQCAALGDRVILGVTGDSDAEGYKRRPVVPEEERTAIVGALREVDKVVCPCPLVVTEEFMQAEDIDLVVHGFAAAADADRQLEFFAAPMRLGRFQRIGYYEGLSTTDRIHNICEQDKCGEEIESNRSDNNAPTNDREGGTDDTDSQEQIISKPQWFGATLAAATDHSPTIPTNPFPLALRTAIESHVEKARVRRKEALNAIKMAMGTSVYDSIVGRFQVQQERLKLVHLDCPETDSEQILYCQLLESLLVSAGLPQTIDLSMLHKEPPVDGRTAKDRLLHALTQNYGFFQESYDTFVRKVCVPRMVQALGGSSAVDGAEPSSCTKVYYQAFPCLRIVQPGDFSIGPHSDVAYGHHPCSVNGYVSLTKPDGGRDESEAPASALFLESRPGAEDWHPLFERTTVPLGTSSRTRLFAGALNLHWTTENLTDRTRITFDFRMINGDVFESLRGGRHLEGGQKDIFRETPGYYHLCHRNEEGNWIRDTTRHAEMACPDFRVGFPWTVKNWDKFWKKQARQTKTV